MEHFVDKLLNRKYDLRSEINAIERLFVEKVNHESMYDKMCKEFLYWRLRNNYIHFDTFMKETGIEDIVERCYGGRPVSLEEYIYYCEYMLNVISCRSVSEHPHKHFIEQNIFNILNQLNYTMHSENGIRHIIENNILVSEAAEVVKENYDLGEAIYSFNYREVQGDISRKADIICRLYKNIESIEGKAKNFGYSKLLEDIKELSNKLNVRHTPTQKQETVIAAMGKTSYESWLDELFKLCLSMMVLVDYTEKRKDIKELKAVLG